MLLPLCLDISLILTLVRKRLTIAIGNNDCNSFHCSPPITLISEQGYDFFVIIILMTKNDFIKSVKQLHLNQDDYIVIGSGIIGILGIREVDDIDLVVSEKVFRNFESSGEWSKKYFEDGTYYLLNGKYEAGLDWDSKNAKSNLKELKKDQIIVDSIPFINLERLKKWKLSKGRAKDLVDIKLIEQYVTSNLA